MQLQAVNKASDFAPFRHGCGRRAILRFAGFFYTISKMSWIDRVTNEELSHRIKGDRDMLRAIKEGKRTGLVTYCVGTSF